MNALEELVQEFTARNLTLATAESLTAGLVSAGIADVPGASAVLRGGAVTYATACKASVLGVDADLLAERGAVDPDVACSMAEGARRVFGSCFGVSTTGVAGPTEQDGKPVGTVFVSVAHAVKSEAGESSRETVCCHTKAFRFDGDRQGIRRAAAQAAWQLCLDVVRGSDQRHSGVVST